MRRSLNKSVLLTVLDGVRQRRLLNVQFLGRTGEVEFFGNSQKAAQMPKRHTDLLFRQFSRQPEPGHDSYKQSEKPAHANG